MDLGVTMARHWWRRLLASWLVTILPWFIVVWAIFWPHPIWAALVLWWLKPLWDRVPLFVLSRALFGAEPTVGETIRAAPRLWKEHLGLSLFLYRLDPVRTFFLPVLQLEKSAGQTMYRRRGVLLRNSLGSASWLTLTCICLELVVMVGLLGLALIMLPDRPEWSGAFLWEQFEEDQLPVPLRLWYAVSAFVALTVVEPLYVACGFALYVNRRTELEGWDIELIFRQLAQRLQTTSAPAGQRLGTGALVLVAASLAPIGLAWAQSTPPAPRAEETDSATDPAEVINEILARPDFEHREKRRRWRLKNQDREDQPPPPWAAQLAQYLAPVVQVLVLALFGVALAALIYAVLRPWRRSGRPAPRPQPQQDAQRELPREGPASLPSELERVAWELWQQGQGEAALSLLYRGALTQLETRFKIEFPQGATEGECLRLARVRAPAPVAEYFTQLTATWMALAYGHRRPTANDVEGLCHQWPTVFVVAP
jgi:hypothetical protein